MINVEPQRHVSGVYLPTRDHENKFLLFWKSVETIIRLLTAPDGFLSPPTAFEETAHGAIKAERTSTTRVSVEVKDQRVAFPLYAARGETPRQGVSHS